MRFFRQFAAMLLAGFASAAAMAQAGQGWIVDFTWRYEAQATRTLRNGNAGPGGADTRVSGAGDIRVSAEARGSMLFSSKLRGAAAVNMPDSRNEQRYDSWRGYGGKPAFVAIDMVARYDEGVRINRADGEGADAINAARKGQVGHVRYTRYRFEAKANGDDAGWIGDHADLQLDRVANKMMIVNRIDLQANRKVVNPTLSQVTRMDKPAAAGEWDRSVSDDAAWRTLPPFFPRDAIVVDIPPGADEFTVTRTYEAGDMPDPFERVGSPFPRDIREDEMVASRQYRGRGTLTLTVHRAQGGAAASASTAAPATPTAAAKGSTTPTTPAPAPTAPAAAATPANAPNRDTTAQKSEPPKPAQSNAAEEAIEAVKKLRGLFGR